jgi:hypothetical protein
MDSEYFISHPKRNDPNFSKVYSKYRRMNHHYLYLLCLFLIEEKKVFNNENNKNNVM